MPNLRSAGCTFYFALPAVFKWSPLLVFQPAEFATRVAFPCFSKFGQRTASVRSVYEGMPRRSRCIMHDDSLFSSDTRDDSAQYFPDPRLTLPKVTNTGGDRGRRRSRRVEAKVKVGPHRVHRVPSIRPASLPSDDCASVFLVVVISRRPASADVTSAHRRRRIGHPRRSSPSIAPCCPYRMAGIACPTDPSKSLKRSTETADRMRGSRHAVFLVWKLSKVSRLLISIQSSETPARPVRFTCI